MQPIAPTTVRYIKLGPGGAWAAECFASGEMRFGYAHERHDLAARRDWEGMVADYVTRAKISSKARDATREFKAFYELGADCLWITIADQHLWWAFCDPVVTPIPEALPNEAGSKRKTIGGWHKTDIRGAPLRLDRLSSKLTQVAAYQQTICSVKAVDYLLRRINAVTEPIVVEAQKLRTASIATARTMIEHLHWSDFEVMVDLIFARGGWQRSSVVGGTMADIDLLIEQPTLNETASVQVKSRATQAVLDEHIAYFAASGLDRTFFVCHSPQGSLSAGSQPGVHLWTGDQLADLALRSGLFDWLIEKSG